MIEHISKDKYMFLFIQPGGADLEQRDCGRQTEPQPRPRLPGIFTIISLVLCK